MQCKSLLTHRLEKNTKKNVHVIILTQLFNVLGLTLVEFTAVNSTDLESTDRNPPSVEPTDTGPTLLPLEVCRTVERVLLQVVRKAKPETGAQPGQGTQGQSGPRR